MNLPQLTSYIGEHDNSSINEFSKLIEKINLKNLKEEQQPYVVSMVFDLKADRIGFEILGKYQEDSEEKYFYFGNNSRAGLQYYLARDSSSLGYLLYNVWDNLYKKLKDFQMTNTDLYKLIEHLAEKSLIKLGCQKGEKQINDKKIKFTNETISNNEEYIRLFFDDSNKNNRFVLIVPLIRDENQEEIILSCQSDYLEVVRRDQGLNIQEADTKQREDEERVCYICKQKKFGVSIDFSTKFSGKRINKIFEITTKRTSRYIEDFNYDHAYSFCNSCYQKLLAGEKIISAKFSTSLIREKAFIIPEGLYGQFDYNYLFKVKEVIDMAFSKNVNDWLIELENSAEIDQLSGYTVNIIIYRTDGNSVSVLLAIEDVPTLHIKEVIQKLANESIRLAPHVKKISLRTIYRIIPVRTNKNREQLDISRILTLYRALLQREMVDVKTLFSYASEALDKGIKQLNKSEIDNYFNMDLSRYLKYENKEDFFIKNLIMSYLVLFQTCQQLDILNRSIFEGVRKEVGKMSDINTFSEKVDASIKEMEKFIDHQGFPEQAKALFYIGILINRVAIAQMAKEHRTKPVLKKIQFQGMTRREIDRLYQDVIEKLRQYNKLTLFAEAVMNRMHYYYGSLNTEWLMDEHANVFYLMSGYAYMVGKKPVDLTPDEENAQEKFDENDTVEEDEKGE